MHAIKTAAIFAGLCAVATTGAAGARTFNTEPADQVSVRVSYSDLDLKTPAGARTLRSRLEDAVTRIKGDDAFSSDHEDASQIGRRAADMIISEQQAGRSSLPRNVVSVG